MENPESDPKPETVSEIESEMEPASVLFTKSLICSL